MVDALISRVRMHDLTCPGRSRPERASSRPETDDLMDQPSDMDAAFAPNRRSSAARPAASWTRIRSRPGSSSPSSAGRASRSPRSTAAPALGFLEEAVIAEELGRALVAGPVADDDRPPPRAPGRGRRPRSPRGEASWTLALDELVRRTSTPRRGSPSSAATGSASSSGAERERARDDGRDAAARRRDRRRARPRGSPTRRSCPRSAPGCTHCWRWRPSASAPGRSSSRSSTPDPRPVRPHDRRLPGDLAPARDDRTPSSSSRARSRYWAAWCVAEDEPQAAARRRRSEGPGLRGRGRRLRALDPGPRRDRLHVGARAAPPVQARAGDSDSRCVPGAAPGGGRERAARRRRRRVL